MNIGITSAIGAKFKLSVISSDSGTTQESGWSDNMVLDSGLNRMSVGTWIDRCCVGSSDTPVTSTQTGLQGFVASTTAKNVASLAKQITQAPFYLESYVVWSFPQGVATGALREVGLGWGDSNLWNRALIRDSGGQPLTINVGAGDILSVTARVRIYPAMGGNGQGSFSLRDENQALISTHTYQVYPFLSYDTSSIFTLIAEKVTLTGPQWSILASDEGITANPSDFNAGTYSQSEYGSVSNTYPTAKSCKATAVFGREYGNEGQHRSFLIYAEGIFSDKSHLGFKWEIFPPISKSNVQTLQYSVSVTWQRYS